MQDLHGQNYLVVGGSSGIGLSIVRRLAEADASVTVLSRNAPPPVEGVAVTHHAFDVTVDTLSPESVPEVLHGFAYCPGTINLRAFHRLPADTFRDDFELNVVGAVRTLQACLPSLQLGWEESSVPSRILLFSTVAVAQGMSMHASVAASKGAVEGLTRSIAMELAPKIRANCVAPSLTDTPLAARFLADDAKRAAADKRHPIGRFGQADDLAKASVFLLTDESSWTTGQVLAVDGGMSSLRQL